MTAKSRHRGGSASAYNWAKRTSFRAPGVRPVVAKAVMLLLTDYVDERWSTFAGQRRLAEEADISERTVREFLAVADEVGWLCRERSSAGEGRGRKEDRIYLHVDGLRELCPCEDQAAEPAGCSAGPTGSSEPTKRQVEPDQAASSADPSFIPNPRTDNPVIPAPDGASEGSLSAEDRFEVFWQQYPTRNGKRVGKRDALRVWLRLSLEEHRAAYRGLLHYAAWCAATDTFPKDAHRWLTKRLWEEFQEPGAPSQRGSPRRNGGGGFGLIRDAWEDAIREEQASAAQ